MEKPIVVLTGPTAVGKTKLSVELAKMTGGEIISADSMQVYRHMDIGSAKITPQEMNGVPHHLIDVLDPDEEFHVVRFQQMAKEALRQIYENGHLPIVAGGTGFYIQALLYDIDFTMCREEDNFRRELEDFASSNGAIALHRRLEALDPKAAENIHPNNVKRVIRALEYNHQTGGLISEHNETQRRRKSPYRFAYFVLTDDRARLYQQIDERVDKMIRDGLAEEVRKLKEFGCTRDMVSMQGLGYKEMLDYLDGACTLKEAVYRIKRDTRHFAKRQITWFKRERDVTWLDKREYQSQEKLLQTINQHLEGVLCCGNYSGVPDL